MLYLYIARTAVLMLSIMLGLPAFGLIIHWIQITTSGPRSVLYDFEIVGLLAGILGVLIWPAMLIVPLFRKNVFLLNITFELTAFLVLWVLWMVTAILVIQWRDIFYPPPYDSCNFVSAVASGLCREFFAIQGLTITIFVFNMLYLIGLFIFALVLQAKGRPVWKVSVAELDITNTSTGKLPPQNNIAMDSYSQDPLADPSSYNQQPGPLNTTTSYASPIVHHPAQTGTTTTSFQQASAQMPNLPQV